MATVAGALAAATVVIASGGAPGQPQGSTPAASALAATGPLSIANSKEGSAILTASGMAPGQSQSGIVDIQNSGSVDAAFTLAQSHVTGATLAANLGLAIVDCGTFAGATAPSCDAGDPQVYAGALNGLPVKALGTYVAGVHAPLPVHRRLPERDGLPRQRAPGPGLQRAVRLDRRRSGDDDHADDADHAHDAHHEHADDEHADQHQLQPEGGGLTPSGGGVQTAPKLLMGGSTTGSDPGAVSFTAICDRACSLTVGGTVSVPGAARVYRLGKVVKSLRPGVKINVRIPFNRTTRNAVRKAMSKGKRSTVRLTLTVRNGSKVSTSHRTIVIRRSRGHR